jgi:DNA-directed RNA polymerase subunit RPC12/RpoP
MNRVHTPKFGKKCFNCTNRFICWTNKEQLPEKDGLPACRKCGSELVVLETYVMNLDLARKAEPITVVYAKCPEHRLFNGHDKGKYYQISPKKWFKWF